MKRPADTKTDAHWKIRFDRDGLSAMKFVIIGFDGPEGEAKRKIYRPAHLANMEPLDQAGRVVLAGPLTDKTGSLIVIEADSLEEAERFAREDPYTVHGVFERVEVHPFTQNLPKIHVTDPVIQRVTIFPRPRPSRCRATGPAV